MLTRKQHELLMFIHERLKETGVSPSFDEMKEALDLASKSGIHRLITALEERGFLRRLPHRARALEVVKLPEQTSVADKRPERGSFSPKVIQGDFKGALPGAMVASAVEAVELPLWGRIAAGTPIEALRDPSQSVSVPGAMIGPGAEHYALEIQGDSMVEAGILSGDFVVVRRQQSARNGEIVVALAGDDETADEATVKRFFREDGRIRLQPENAALEPLYPRHVQVLGKVIGVFRRV
jgi:repressor LexA